MLEDKLIRFERIKYLLQQWLLVIACSRLLGNSFGIYSVNSIFVKLVA